MLYMLCSAEEEISLMKMELDKYGINMPSFGKIGGILTNQVCVCVCVCVQFLARNGKI